MIEISLSLTPRANMKTPIYEWKQMYSVIKIMHAVKNSRLMKLLEEKKNCAQHQMDYVLSGDKYRLYRRGVKRCHGCGIKFQS